VRTEYTVTVYRWIGDSQSGALVPDVLQSSPVHEGVGDPRQALEELFEFYVARC
jgi:hypothetical protein